MSEPAPEAQVGQGSMSSLDGLAARISQQQNLGIGSNTYEMGTDAASIIANADKYCCAGCDEGTSNDASQAFGSNGVGSNGYHQSSSTSDWQNQNLGQIGSQADDAYAGDHDLFGSSQNETSQYNATGGEESGQTQQYQATESFSFGNLQDRIQNSTGESYSGVGMSADSEVSSGYNGTHDLFGGVEEGTNQYNATGEESLGPQGSQFGSSFGSLQDRIQSFSADESYSTADVSAETVVLEADKYCCPGCDDDLSKSASDVLGSSAGGSTNYHQSDSTHEPQQGNDFDDLSSLFSDAYVSDHDSLDGSQSEISQNETVQYNADNGNESLGPQGSQFGSSFGNLQDRIQSFSADESYSTADVSAESVVLEADKYCCAGCDDDLSKSASDVLGSSAGGSTNYHQSDSTHEPQQGNDFDDISSLFSDAYVSDHDSLGGSQSEISQNETVQYNTDNGNESLGPQGSQFGSSFGSLQDRIQSFSADESYSTADVSAESVVLEADKYCCAGCDDDLSKSASDVLGSSSTESGSYRHAASASEQMQAMGSSSVNEQSFEEQGSAEITSTLDSVTYTSEVTNQSENTTNFSNASVLHSNLDQAVQQYASKTTTDMPQGIQQSQSQQSQSYTANVVSDNEMNMPTTSIDQVAQMYVSSEASEIVSAEVVSSGVQVAYKESAVTNSSIALESVANTVAVEYQSTEQQGVSVQHENLDQAVQQYASEVTTDTPQGIQQSQSFDSHVSLEIEANMPATTIDEVAVMYSSPQSSETMSVEVSSSSVQVAYQESAGADSSLALESVANTVAVEYQSTEQQGVSVQHENLDQAVQQYTSEPNTDAMQTVQEVQNTQSYNANVVSEVETEMPAATIDQVAVMYSSSQSVEVTTPQVATNDGQIKYNETTLDNAKVDLESVTQLENNQYQSNESQTTAEEVKNANASESIYARSEKQDSSERGVDQNSLDLDGVVSTLQQSYQTATKEGNQSEYKGVEADESLEAKYEVVKKSAENSKDVRDTRDISKIDKAARDISDSVVEASRKYQTSSQQVENVTYNATTLNSEKGIEVVAQELSLEYIHRHESQELTTSSKDKGDANNSSVVYAGNKSEIKETYKANILDDSDEDDEDKKSTKKRGSKSNKKEKEKKRKASVKKSKEQSNKRDNGHKVLAKKITVKSEAGTKRGRKKSGGIRNDKQRRKKRGKTRSRNSTSGRRKASNSRSSNRNNSKRDSK